MSEAGGGHTYPQDFGRSAKPYLNQEGQIMPSNYVLLPHTYFQTFRHPCYIYVLIAVVCLEVYIETSGLLKW